MNRLAIETATDFCSVALQSGDEVRIRECHAPRRHAELLVPWIRELMTETGLDWPDLDALAVSRGPGGFTSLRIGLGVVQGLALAHDLPVHAVSTLRVLARSAEAAADRPYVLALLDARMGEVYAAWFRNDRAILEPLGSETVTAPESLAPPHRGPWLVAGSGLAVYGEAVRQALAGMMTDEEKPQAWPTARALLALADSVAAVPAWRLEPTYVRDQVTD